MYVDKKERTDNIISFYFQLLGTLIIVFTCIGFAAYDFYLGGTGKYAGYILGVGMTVIGIFSMSVWRRFFTNYERIWFVTVLVLASAVSIMFPQEDIGNVGGIWILALYLADVFLNIAVELLIAKRNKWCWIVDIFLEIVEIAMFIAISEMYVSVLAAALFWIPLDIMIFFNWSRHADPDNKELVHVRSLSSKNRTLLVIGMIIWTGAVGYMLTFIDFGTTLFNGDDTKFIIACYLEACVAACSIINGLLLLLRYRMQWIAWFICSLLEIVITIITKQYILLLMQFAFLMNSIYGYRLWTQYIEEHKEKQKEEKVAAAS